MSWSLYRWVWRLEAPLHVGMPPSGALNRCRLYVPSRALWGAVTAELARGKDSKIFPDYETCGNTIKSDCRFTYLYPAEETSEGASEKYLTWLPAYQENKGLTHRLGQKDLYCPDREFRRRLLDSRAGTAIVPETDSASEGTLHETECISPFWRGGPKNDPAKPVFLVGYVFLKDDAQKAEMENLKTLFIGGDTRYGLGKITRMKWETVSFVWGKIVDLSQEDPVIEKSNVVWGHAAHDDGMFGNKELLGRWDRSERLRENSNILWMPGSRLRDEKTTFSWRLSDSGCWKFGNKLEKA